MKKNVRVVNKETDAQDERRQLLDSTPLTNSLPITLKYYTASLRIPCVELTCVDGNAIRICKTTYMVYLKDQRPPFQADIENLMNFNKFDIRHPELLMSYEDRSKVNKRVLRESKRKEEIEIKMKKEEAENARKQWMISEYNNMVTQIKQNQHTFKDFTGLFEKLCQPFVFTSGDGYITTCSANESICINNMALRAIDGVLCQKRQAEELARLNALQKKRQTSKRKRTPNTTRGDDGIGICMGLMDHDVAAEQDKQKQVNERLQKQSSHLEKTLNEIDALKAKHGGTINLECCLASELSTILIICGLAGGTSGKKRG